MSKEEAKQNDNFHIDKGSVSCDFCRCGRKACHKETKTTTDKAGNTVVNQVEERSSWRLGTGRGTTPDDQSIFRRKILIRLIRVGEKWDRVGQLHQKKQKKE